MKKLIHFAILIFFIINETSAQEPVVSPPTQVVKPNECLSGDFFHIKLDKDCSCIISNSCLDTGKFHKLINNKKLTKSGRELGVGLFKGLNQVAEGKERDFSNILDNIQNSFWYRDVERVLEKVKIGDNEMDNLLKDKLEGDWDSSDQRVEFIRDFKSAADMIDGERGFQFQLVIHASVEETFHLLRQLPMVMDWTEKSRKYQETLNKTKSSTSDTEKDKENK